MKCQVGTGLGSYSLFPFSTEIRRAPADEIILFNLCVERWPYYTGAVDSSVCRPFQHSNDLKYYLT